VKKNERLERKRGGRERDRDRERWKKSEFANNMLNVNVLPFGNRNT